MCRVFSDNSYCTSRITRRSRVLISRVGTYLRCHSSLEMSTAWMRLGRASHGDSSLMAFTIICSSTVAAICRCIPRLLDLPPICMSWFSFPLRSKQCERPRSKQCEQSYVSDPAHFWGERERGGERDGKTIRIRHSLLQVDVAMSPKAVSACACMQSHPWEQIFC